MPEEGLVQSRPGPEHRGAPQPAPTVPPFLRPASSLYSMSAVPISLPTFHCPEVSLRSPRPGILCLQCSSHFQRTAIQNSFLQPLMWRGVESSFRCVSFSLLTLQVKMVLRTQSLQTCSPGFLRHLTINRCHSEVLLPLQPHGLHSALPPYCAKRWWSGLGTGLLPRPLHQNSNASSPLILMGSKSYWKERPSHTSQQCRGD